MWRTLWITGALFALATGLPFTEVHDLEIRKAPNTFAELSKCPGYSASIQEQTSTSLTANLKLSGEPCNAYGADIESLILTVTYETGMNFPVLAIMLGDRMTDFFFPFWISFRESITRKD